MSQKRMDEIGDKLVLVVTVILLLLICTGVLK